MLTLQPELECQEHGKGDKLSSDLSAEAMAYLHLPINKQKKEII